VSEEIEASLRSKDIAVLCKDKRLIPLKICTRVLSLMTIKKVSLVHEVGNLVGSMAGLSDLCTGVAAHEIAAGISSGSTSGLAPGCTAEESLGVVVGMASERADAQEQKRVRRLYGEDNLVCHGGEVLAQDVAPLG
jgi:hypothetical protein